MKKYKILLAIAIMLICISVAAACSAAYKFEPFPHEKTDWRDVEGDADMVVDGKFGESHYTGLNTFLYRADSRNSVEMTAYLGQTGVYVKVMVQDPMLYYNPEMAIYENTCIILYMSPFNDARNGVGMNTIQSRTGLNGNTEQWYGTPESGGYGYAPGVVPMMSRVDILDADKNSVPFTPGEGLIFEYMYGYNVEVYVPYKSMGLTEKPAKLMITPELNVKLDYSGGRTLFSPSYYNSPSTWQVFDANGYNPYASENSVFEGTVGFDLTVDTDGVASQRGAGDQYLRFKDLNAASYVMSADVFLCNNIGNDNYPKVGLLAAEIAGGKRVLFMADPRVGKARKEFLVVENSSGNWTWSNIAPILLPSVDYTKPVTFTVVKDGADFEFFINGMFFVRVNLPAFAGAAKAGFATMNHEADYTNYTYSTDSASIAAAQLSPAKDIDADLKDWTSAEKTNKISLRGQTATDKGFDVYGKYVAGDGLYIGGQAFHSKNTTGKGEWWQNTNFEIFLNGGSETENRRWVIGAKDSGGMLAKLVTTGSNSNFTSTFEVYIPELAIPEYVAGADYIRLGVAFKTESDTMQISGRDNTDWWWESGKNPRELGEFYYVKDGIYKTRPLMDNKNHQFDGTAGWSLPAGNAAVTQTAGGEQKLFYSADGMINYEFTATLKLDGIVVAGEQNAAGLIVAENIRGRRIAVVALPGATQTETKFVVVQSGAGGWAWNTASEFIVSSINSASIVIKVEKQGSGFKFYVDGRFYYYMHLSEYSGRCGMGFLTLNQKATFSAYSRKTMGEPTGIKIDADLKDELVPESTDLAGLRVRGATDTDKGFDLFATVTAEGLYIGGRALHSKSVAGKSDWTENTVFRFYVGETLYWVSANGRSSQGIIAAMKTEGLDGDFISTFEILIPAAELPAGTLRAGFAFMTPGDSIVIKNRNDGKAVDDWYAEGHAPNDTATQYYIYSDGIFVNAKA